MSFARSKVPRFTNDVERPSTASTTGVRHSASAQKSFIPKFRSLSQPPSTQLVKDSTKADDNANYFFPKIPVRTPIDEVDAFKTESVKSEEFKDCFDQKLDNNKPPSRSKDDTDNRIEQLPLDDTPQRKNTMKVEKEPGNLSKRESNMSRKNSSSYIPVCKHKVPKAPLTPRQKKPNLNAVSETRNGTNAPIYRKTMEMFQMKKRRYEMLKREVLDKQKPILDLYKALNELKTKLEENGKHVTLEPIQVIDVPASSPKPDLSGGGEEPNTKVPVDPKIPEIIKTKIEEVPAEFNNFSKCIMDKHLLVVELLVKFADAESDIEIDLDSLKNETAQLQSFLQKSVEEQERTTQFLMEYWNQSIQSGIDNSEMEKISEYEQIVKRQDAQLKEVLNDLQKTKQQLKEVKPFDQDILDEEIAKYKDKIMHLEKVLETEKKKHHQETEKYRSADTSLKSLKNKVKDFDNSKQQFEAKIAQLTQELRASQSKLKTNEKNYEKEIADLSRARHLDKSLIERLNKDQTTFESRLKTAVEISEKLKAEFFQREMRLLEEIHEHKLAANSNHKQVLELKSEVEMMSKEISNLQVHNQQATNIMNQLKHSHQEGDTAVEQKQCALELELSTQKTTIKELEDEVESLTSEKMRFISSITLISEEPKDLQGVTKILLKKDDEIGRKCDVIRRKEEIIMRQKLDIDKLRSKMNNFKEQLETLQSQEDTSELKHMLKEGKTKLELALVKSLENEHKIIKYEHELAQKSQALSNIENMLRVRDGLIGVMKAKKDELSLENHSLSKYSEEIRMVALASREELNEKDELIQSLQSTMNSQQIENVNLEKQITELEEKLEVTNEKRYKLQNSVSHMEKELQASKAHIQQIEEMQTRYDPDRLSANSTVTPAIGMQNWKMAGETVFRKYRKSYEDREKHYSDNRARCQKYEFQANEYMPCKDSEMRCVTVESSLDQNAGLGESSNAYIFPTTVVPPQTEILGGGQEINFSDRGELPVNIKITVL